jgi:hypothetical protein
MGHEDFALIIKGSMQSLLRESSLYLSLMDELAAASWFSKLDLRAGYHQICLAPREEYKTTFQTHCTL